LLSYTFFNISLLSIIYNLDRLSIFLSVVAGAGHESRFQVLPTRTWLAIPGTTQTLIIMTLHKLHFNVNKETNIIISPRVSGVQRVHRRPQRPPIRGTPPITHNNSTRARCQSANANVENYLRLAKDISCGCGETFMPHATCCNLMEIYVESLPFCLRYPQLFHRPTDDCWLVSWLSVRQQWQQQFVGIFISNWPKTTQGMALVSQIPVFRKYIRI